MSVRSAERLPLRFLGGLIAKLQEMSVLKSAFCFQKYNFLNICFVSWFENVSFNRLKTLRPFGRLDAFFEIQRLWLSKIILEPDFASDLPPLVYTRIKPCHREGYEVQAQCPMLSLQGSSEP